VRLYRAARAEKVTFRHLHREEPLQNPERISGTQIDSPVGRPSRASGSDDSGQRSEPRLKLVPGRTSSDAEPDGRSTPVLTPVRQASIRKESDEIVPAQSVVKGYEYEKNRFVEIDPEELKNAAAQTSSEIAIQEFVKLADIDPVYFETSYYITPEAAGESLRSFVPLHARNRLGCDCTICDAQPGTRRGASPRQEGYARAHHVLYDGSPVE
jgi:hypothetical protein